MTVETCGVAGIRHTLSVEKSPNSLEDFSLFLVGILRCEVWNLHGNFSLPFGRYDDGVEFFAAILVHVDWGMSMMFGLVSWMISWIT